jgi:hypothetical protein
VGRSRRKVRSVALLVALIGALAATESGASGQTGSCLPTSARLVEPHSFKGLIPRPRAQAYTDLTQFATADGSSLDDPFVQQFIAALQNEGFVSGIAQLYNPPKHRRHKGFRGQALAEAIQVSDPEQAAIEAAREHEVALSQGPWKRFTVAAIPGSTGLLEPVTRKFPAGASNVYFSDGPYAYLIGEAPRRGTGYGAVVSAAKRLYLRVHAAPVCA